MEVNSECLTGKSLDKKMEKNKNLGLGRDCKWGNTFSSDPHSGSAGSIRDGTRCFQAKIMPKNQIPDDTSLKLLWGGRRIIGQSQTPPKSS